MKLRIISGSVITEWGPSVARLDDGVRDRLAAIYPGSIIDYGQTPTHYPFIYVGEGPGQGMHIGAENTFHAGLLYNDDECPAVYQNQIPGIVGRIGYDLSKYSPQLKDSSIVSIYVNDKMTGSMIKRALTELLHDGLIKNDTFFSVNDELSMVGDILGGGDIEASEEAKRKGALQVALHLGAWPDGRRLTDDEKKAIRKELGIEKGGGRVSQWREPLRDIGVHHAPWRGTSEGIERR